MYPDGLAAAPVVMPESRISVFRRFLASLSRLMKRPDAGPAGPSPLRPSLEPARDPEIAQALVRVRDCVCAARELVPPTEWNAKLEWILGSERCSKCAADLDRETVDAVVSGLHDLEARVNRAALEASKNLFEAARRDHLSPQSVARGLRDATVCYVQASGFSTPSTDFSDPPESRFPN